MKALFLLNHAQILTENLKTFLTQLFMVCEVFRKMVQKQYLPIYSHNVEPNK